MRNLMITLLQIVVIIFFLTSNIHSELKPYDGPEFDLISYRLKVEKSKIPGSGYTQNKPDPLNRLTEKLVQKGMEYVEKYGLENTI
ncbi:MAG: hypothetical protein PF570_09485, partial [Candidatus Cloacimonetes bacterium]|nr:hypothetical protein [Candidatus Cloacimonadota bacterium]